MPPSSHAVTPAGTLAPVEPQASTTAPSPRRTFSWRQFFDPLAALDLSTLDLDAATIEADLAEGFERGGHRVGSPCVRPASLLSLR